MKREETLTRIIKSRRSIFPSMYTGEMVRDDVIWQILDNANWAPTHKQTEPWFFVVMPQAKISNFCLYAAQWYKEYTPSKSFNAMKYKKMKTKALSASHIIVVCMKRDEAKRVPKWEEKAAVACAVQNMYLSVTAMGLGGYWSTPGYALAGDEYFNLQKGEKCLGLFYVGVPKEGLRLEGKRQDIKTKVRWM